MVFSKAIIYYLYKPEIVIVNVSENAPVKLANAN